MNFGRLRDEWNGLKSMTLEQAFWTVWGASRMSCDVLWRLFVLTAICCFAIAICIAYWKLVCPLLVGIAVIVWLQIWWTRRQREKVE